MLPLSGLHCKELSPKLIDFDLPDCYLVVLIVLAVEGLVFLDALGVQCQSLNARKSTSGRTAKSGYSPSTACSIILFLSPAAEKAILRMCLKSSSEIIPGDPMFLQNDIFLVLVDVHQISLQHEQGSLFLAGRFFLHKGSAQLFCKFGGDYQHLLF